MASAARELSDGVGGCAGKMEEAAVRARMMALVMFCAMVVAVAVRARMLDPVTG